MKLIIEVEFGLELTEKAQREVKKIVQELKDDLEYVGGKVVRADLIPAPAREAHT